jgi:putative hydrolase of the HAD superfamily
MKTQVILFDADGVLTLPEEVFSIVYARSHGFDVEPFEQFFRNDWQEIVTGKKDLKESIAENQELWRWDGSPEELLKFWFETEDVRNEELLEIISKLKAKGIFCYLATDQEKYRGEYMQSVMFKDIFDGYFISASLGVTKTNPKFFEMIIEQLQQKYPELRPQDITFFDDSQSKVDTACSVGINGQLYKDIEQVKALLLVNN